MERMGEGKGKRETNYQRRRRVARRERVLRLYNLVQEG
jgi:hypothetical protein